MSKVEQQFIFEKLVLHFCGMNEGDRKAFTVYSHVLNTKSDEERGIICSNIHEKWNSVIDFSPDMWQNITDNMENKDDQSTISAGEEHSGRGSGEVGETTLPT